MAAITTAPQTSLQRTGKFTFTAMIVAKGTPSNWVKQTVLLRLVEQSGAETMLTATNEAFKTCVALEKWRIYEFQLKGTCVKQSTQCSRYGVRSSLEVKLLFPCSLALSKTAWPLKFPLPV